MSTDAQTPETTFNENQPPEVAGELPQDPDVVGALTPQEMGLLQSLRARSGQITTEIGNLEVRKARLLGSLSELEDRANQVIQAVGKRLGLEEGVQFQLLPDGRVRVIPQASPGEAQ